MAAKELAFRYLLFLVIIFLLFTFVSCHVSRYVYWNLADIGDGTKFPADSIGQSAHSEPFPSPLAETEIFLPSTFINEDSGKELATFLSAHKTVAFLIIRNDSLIYERYFDGYTKESVLPSFSIAKSFVSALVGAAIAEGKIGSLDQVVTDFLPEIEDTGFRTVSLRDLLEMRSGIKFNEGYSNPFGEMARFYYGLNLKKYTLSLKTESKPGVEYNYQSANTQLLAMILERATGKPLPEYMEETIWKPMGGGSAAWWNVDSRKNHEVKAFCCINATAGDFARFGQLFLENGIVNGDTVIPPQWVKESLAIRTDSRDSQGFPYTYHWRVTEEGDFFAKGVLGQYIYVCPGKKIVIVRIGKRSTDLVWARFFRELIISL